MISSREFETRLARRARRASLVVPADLAAHLWSYFELLLLWNRKINLTAFDAASPDSALDRLLIEPLQAARHVPVEARRIIDIGSGGGSPAIPMKLALTGSTLVMVEPKARKSAFLREAVRVLALTDTQVETARFEELLARPELHEVLDILTVRAVRVERKTLVSLQAFLRPGGRMLLFQGVAGSEAVEAIPPPLTLHAVHPLTPDAPSSRLVILSKRVPRGTMLLDEAR